MSTMGVEDIFFFVQTHLLVAYFALKNICVSSDLVEKGLAK